MLNFLALVPTIAGTVAGSVASVGLFGVLAEALGSRVVAGVVSFGAGYFISAAAKTTAEEIIKGTSYIQAITQ